MVGNVFLVVQCIFGSADIFTTMENCKYKLASLALFLSPSLVTAPQMICHKFILYSHVHVLAHIHHMYHIYIYCIPAGLVYDHCVSLHVRNHPALLRYCLFLVTWQLLVWWWPCPIHHLAAEWRCIFLFHMESYACMTTSLELNLEWIPWKKDIALMKHAICYGYMLYYKMYDLYEMLRATLEARLTSLGWIPWNGDVCCHPLNPNKGSNGTPKYFCFNSYSHGEVKAMREKCRWWKKLGAATMPKIIRKPAARQVGPNPHLHVSVYTMYKVLSVHICMVLNS